MNDKNIVGVLHFLDNGEKIEYTDPAKYVSDFTRQLASQGIHSVKAETLTTNIETHFKIFEASLNEFGDRVDRDVFYRQAEKHGFSSPWDESAVIEIEEIYNDNFMPEDEFGIDDIPAPDYPSKLERVIEAIKQPFASQKRETFKEKLSKAVFKAESINSAREVTIKHNSIER